MFSSSMTSKVVTTELSVSFVYVLVLLLNFVLIFEFHVVVLNTDVDITLEAISPSSGIYFLLVI